MILKELFLIISYVGLILCIALVFYFLYVFKGAKVYKKILPCFLLPAILFLIYPIFTGVSSIVNNVKYNDFEIEIGSKLEDLDFSNLYEKMYKKSNAKTDLILTKNHKDIKIFIDSQGNITEFSIKIIVPKYNKYFYYTSYYNNKKIIFVFSSALEEVKLDEVHYYKPYIDRLDLFNFKLILNSLNDSAYKYGMGIDLSFNYYNIATNITLINDPNSNINHLAYDKNNNLIQDQIIEVSKENINIKLASIPKELSEDILKLYDEIKIFGKEYYYKNKDIIELINFN